MWKLIIVISTSGFLCSLFLSCRKNMTFNLYFFLLHFWHIIFNLVTLKFHSQICCFATQTFKIYTWRAKEKCFTLHLSYQSFIRQVWKYYSHSLEHWGQLSFCQKIKELNSVPVRIPKNIFPQVSVINCFSADLYTVCNWSYSCTSWWF